MKKNELKEKYNKLLNEFGLTFINESTKEADEIKDKYNHIKYETIYQAYTRPSAEKIKTCEICKNLIDNIAKYLEGSVINKGIQGAGKDNYNYLGKIKSDTLTMWIYCTKGYNKVIIKEA